MCVLAREREMQKISEMQATHGYKGSREFIKSNWQTNPNREARSKSGSRQQSSEAQTGYHRQRQKLQIKTQNNINNHNVNMSRKAW